MGDKKKQKQVGIHIGAGEFAGLRIQGNTFSELDTAISIAEGTEALIADNVIIKSRQGIEVRVREAGLEVALREFLAEAAHGDDVDLLRQAVERMRAGEIKGETLPAVIETTTPRLRAFAAFLRPQSGAEIAAWAGVILQAIGPVV